MPLKRNSAEFEHFEVLPRSQCQTLVLVLSPCRLRWLQKDGLQKFKEAPSILFLAFWKTKRLKEKVAPLGYLNKKKKNKHSDRLYRVVTFTHSSLCFVLFCFVLFLLKVYHHTFVACCSTTSIRLIDHILKFHP